MKPFPVSSLLLLALAGCSGIPKTRPPGAGLDMPGSYRAATSSTANGTGLDREWWRAFDQPGLDQAIRQALQHNRDLAIAAARVDQALAEARIAGAALRPQAQAQGSVSRLDQSVSGQGGTGPFGGIQSGVNTDLHAFGFSASWEVDLWGRLRAGKEAARSQAAMAEADWAAARTSLAGQTAKAWFQLAAADRQLALAKTTAASHEGTLQQVRYRYDRGLRPSLDVRLAEGNLETARALLRDRELAVTGARHRLGLLLGQFPDAALPETGALVELPPPPALGLPGDLLRRRPDVQAAELRLRAMDAAVLEAQAARLPRISLSAAGDQNTQPFLTSPLTVGAWTFAINATQPLFQGGRLKAGESRARARTREALAAYQQVLLRSVHEVEETLAAETQLGQRERHLESAARQARAAEALARDRYARGLESIFAVLETQRRSLEAETTLTNLRRARLDRRIDLILSLGGGYDALAPPILDAASPVDP